MNKYNSTALEYHVDAQELLHIARLENLPLLINT